MALRVTDALSRRAPSRELATVSALLLYGVGLCALAAGATDFPPLDGGLVLVMIEDLRRAGLSLPDVTSYNAAAIPFAYPPLGLYCGAIVSSLTGVDTLTVLRWLPMSFASASLVAFALLASRVLATPLARAVALGAFIVLPTNVWLVGGGGVTRAPGSLFLLLTLWQATHLAGRSRGAIVGTGAALGLTALSHPEALLSALLYSTAIAVTSVAPRTSMVRLAVAWAVGALVAAPWWTVILLRHGPGAFLSAADLGFGWASGIYRLVTLRITAEDGFPTVAALAVLGVAACAAKRSWRLPLLLALIALQPHSPQHRAAIPVALLAGLGFAEVVAPALARLATPRRVPAWATAGALTLLLMTSSATALTGTGHAFEPLPRHERVAMQWLSEHAPAGAGVLVVSGAGWSGDLSSEWLPALTRQRSIATAQGLEWTGRFRSVVTAHESAQRCAGGPATCLDEWMAATGLRFEFVYLKGAVAPDAVDATAGLRAAIASDPRYELVYVRTGVAIASRR